MSDGDYSEYEESSGLPPYLSDPMGILERRGRWISLAAGIGSFLGLAAVLLWPAEYQANAKILVSSQTISDELVPSVTVDRLEEQLGAIRGGVLSRPSLLGLMEELAIDEAHERVDLVSMREAITIELDSTGGRGSSTFIVDVGFVSEEPEVSARIANALANRLVATHRERRSEQVRTASEFLEKEMERGEIALREQTARVRAFKEQHRGELPSELPTKLARLERLQQERQSLGVQISDAESRLLQLGSQAVGADTRTQLLSELRIRLVNERIVHTEEHPNVESLKSQISSLEQELATSPPQLVMPTSNNAAAAEIRREIASLRSQLAHAAAQADRLDAQVSRTPARQEELDALLQREEVLRETYLQAQRKVQEAKGAQSLELAQQGLRVELLEPATPPVSPLMPWWKLSGIAAILVLGVAGGLGVLLELLDPVMLSASQMESETGVVQLGVVPRIE
jgi:succinoglycan biosynthesis transport protein ExoP